MVWRLARRDFLKLAGTGAGVIALEACCPKPLIRPDGPADRYVEEVLRRDDQLRLQFTFVNFRRDGGTLRLTQRDGFVVVAFPTQHILERAFFEKDGEAVDKLDYPVLAAEQRASPAWRTRLVFRVKRDLRYRLDDFLGWAQQQSDFEPELIAPSNDGSIEPLEPKELQTAIELPTYLFLNPRADTWWATTRRPTEDEKTVELWHCRLQPRSPPAPMRGAAVWADDYGKIEAPGDAEGKPVLDDFRHSMSPAVKEGFGLANRRVRRSIINRNWGTGDYAAAFKQDDLRLDNLMLSSMGGWLKTEGHWKLDDAGPKLESWRHTTTMGRDQFAQVIDKVFLFPFGHAATIVSETNRKFERARPDDPNDGRVVAALRQKNFLLVTEEEKHYRDGARERFDIPHQSIRFQTLRSPDILPDKRVVPGLEPQGKSDPDFFWVQLQKSSDEALTHFQFQLEGTDHADGKQTFRAPAIVITNCGLVELKDKTKRQAVLDKLNAEYQRVLRLLAQKEGFDIPASLFADREVAFIDTTRLEGAVDQALHARGIQFQGRGEDLYPYFSARMGTAWVRSPNISRLFGQDLTVEIEFLRSFLQEGFTQAKSLVSRLGVFAQVNTPLNFDVSAGKNVRLQLVVPNMPLNSLSAKIGLSSLSQALIDETHGAQKLDLSKYFPSDGSVFGNLFGGIPLGKLLGKVSLGSGAGGLTDLAARVPQLTRVNDEIVYRWCVDPSDLQDAGPFVRGPGTPSLCVEARVYVGSEPGRPHVQVTTTLANFSLKFFEGTEFIRVQFEHVKSTTVDGHAPNVDVKVRRVVLSGALDFIQQLAGSVTGQLRRNPIEVSNDFFRYSHLIAVPNVDAGGLSITNLALKAGIEVPFNGAPVGVTIGFAERKNPFLVTVSALGGGGFFAVQLRVGKTVTVDRIEGAIEFGGRLALDLVVAHGEVYILAGIYFRFENDAFTVIGYLRCGGALDVLGLITICVEFYLSLAYEKNGSRSQLVGEARLTVSIELLFVSVAVELQVKKCISLDSGGFCQMLNEGNEQLADLDWAAYSEAFV